MLNSLREELESPVSIDERGRPVTLYEFTRKDSKCLSLSQLSSHDRAKVVAERLRRRPKYKVAAIGIGEIDQRMAIAEVEALSDIGQSLIEREQYGIEMLVEEVKEGRLKDVVEKLYTSC
ncbi:MAG: hypothetical protein QNJ55_28990 [Xenococcus sp. MO_188.B8]|nr:hypothetical protein [Xenococcus sp. MO_188.B8]